MRDKRFTLVLSQEEHEKLKKAATKEGWTMTTYIRELLKKDRNN